MKDTDKLAIPLEKTVCLFVFFSFLKREEREGHSGETVQMLKRRLKGGEYCGLIQSLAVSLVMLSVPWILYLSLSM